MNTLRCHIALLCLLLAWPEVATAEPRAHAATLHAAPPAAKRLHAGRRTIASQVELPETFLDANRELIEAGPWGCPSPLVIHPLARVPTFAFWQQADYSNPQPGDGLKWAVYVGWPDGNPWRFYSIPLLDSNGLPVTRLERPRISLTYDPDGYPAIAIGLDDGGVRYNEGPPNLANVYMGSIALVRPDRDAAGAWATEIVPFNLGFSAINKRLEYPSVVFTANGRPVVTAVGYPLNKDSFGGGNLTYPEGQPFARMMLARKRNNGSWKVQDVLVSICPPDEDCTGCPSAGGITNDPAPPAIRELQRTAQAGEHTSSATPLTCPFSQDPLLRYIPAYPSLSLRQDQTVRVLFSFGEHPNAVSDFRNFLYAVGFDVSNSAFNSNGALPTARTRKINSNSTPDYWDDYFYSGLSEPGGMLLSVDRHLGGLPVMNEYMVRRNASPLQWPKVNEASIPILPDYDRLDFRFWLPATIQPLPENQNDFGFLTPHDAGGLIWEDDPFLYGTTLSYFSTSDDGCGGALLCSQPIVSPSSGLNSFESTLAFGAFHPDLGRQQEALALFHTNIGNGLIMLSPQYEALPLAAGFGDFDFLGGAGSCTDDCAIIEAVSDNAWTNNPLCDVDGDGAVNDIDLAAYGQITGCCNQAK